MVYFHYMEKKTEIWRVHATPSRAQVAIKEQNLDLSSNFLS